MSAPLHAFGGAGIELEHMIVDRESLDVLPIADRLLAASPDGLPAAFRREVGQVNALLAGMGARLMPGAMHPWMAPDRETRLWPHQNQETYQADDRIFDSRGHGWSNLQSVHVYSHNADRMPSIAGLVAPETVRSQADCEARILQPMYDDIAALDPDRVLRHEWLNSRGAIARFDRDAIEIRAIDIQEHPGADLAVAVVDVTRRLHAAGSAIAWSRVMPSCHEPRCRRCMRPGAAPEPSL